MDNSGQPPVRDEPVSDESPEMHHRTDVIVCGDSRDVTAPFRTNAGAADRGGVMRRVVVTGVGVVAPNGVGREAFWNACVNGESGVGPIRSFDTSSLPVHVAGEV